MKKVINKKIIFGFILGLIVCGVIGVGATYLYTANQISYNNSKTEKTNVNDALDEVYNMISLSPKNEALEILSFVSTDQSSSVTKTYASTVESSNAKLLINDFTYYSGSGYQSQAGGTMTIYLNDSIIKSYTVSGWGADISNSVIIDIDIKEGDVLKFVRTKKIGSSVNTILVKGYILY